MILRVALFALWLACACTEKASPADTGELLSRALGERGCKIVSRKDLLIHFACSDSVTGSVSLVNLEKQLAGTKEADARLALARRFLASLSLRDTPGGEAFPRESILFAIKPKSYLEATMARLPPELRGKAGIPAKPLAAGTMIVWVIDRAQTMHVVTVSHLNKWKVAPATLVEAATKNLAAKPAEAKVLRGEGGATLAAFQSGDSYDAARILLPGSRKALETRVGGRAVFGIPHRDLLVAAKADAPRAVKALRALIAKEAGKPYAITTEVLRFDEAIGFRVVPP
jgi:hypothetical protein